MHGKIQQIRSAVRRSRSRLWTLLRQSTLIVLLAGTMMVLGPRAPWSAEPEIVARVNGEPVSRAELQRVLDDPLALRELQQDLGSKKADRNEHGSEALERLALQELIHRRLLLQEAARRNFTVSAEEHDQALTALRNRFKDLKDFGVWMKARGLDDRSLFDTLRAQVLMTKVWTALVEDIRPSEKEVQAYYEVNKEDLIMSEEVRLRVIAVSDKAEAEEIMAAVRKGEPFDRLARRRSRGRLAAKGGETGWVDFQALPSPLREAAAELKPGEVGGPLEKGPGEFLIVGLQDRRPVRAKSLDQARPEIKRRLLPEKQREVVQEWLAEQEKKSKIEVILQTE